MKIKFIDPMYHNYTGVFGTTEFVDGASVGDVSEKEARLYGSIAAIEIVEGDPLDRSYDEIKEIQAVSMNLPTTAEILARKAAEEAEQGAAAPSTPDAPQKMWTAEELEVIADKSGIAGLREIGDTLNVHSTSIKKLIASILAAQKPQAPEVQFIESPAEAVSLKITNEDD